MTRPVNAIPRVVRPLQDFLNTETLGGVLLLAAAAAALVWANMPGSTYQDFWGAQLSVDLDVVELDESLRHWVNDGLMAIFFFVVGLEIKRELLEGELSGRERAALPAVAAVGGMVVPACIYIALNAGTDGARGWAIPMATDIAFAVGVMALLGNRVPVSLKVFLVALAIVDDIGAIGVIAVFYTDSIEFGWLAAAAALFGIAAVMGGPLRIRSVGVFLVVGLAAWVAVLESGVHSTIAGVILGFLMPLRPGYDAEGFDQEAPQLLEEFRTGIAVGTPDGAERSKSALREMEEVARDSQPVLDRLEHALHPWTSYVIVPIFALANAGVVLTGGAIGDAAESRIALGVLLGLVVGKPVGITLFAWIAVRMRLAALPADVSWAQLAASGVVAGIGFTVSLFIAELAFDGPALVDEAKIGILFASAVMGAAGFLALFIISRPRAAVGEHQPVAAEAGNPTAAED